MKKTILLLLISFSFSQHFGGTISLVGQFPKGEFKDQGVPDGLGVDFTGKWHPVKELAIGINLGGSRYGVQYRNPQLSLTLPQVTVEEEISNNISYAHLFLKIIPFKGNIRPYIEGLLGFKTLTTTTTIDEEGCVDDQDTDHDECQIAQSTNLEDSAISYGFGTGIDVTIMKIEPEGENPGGRLSLNINFRYIYGAETEYLKKEDIVYTEVPLEGGGSYYTVDYTPNYSKTDLMQIGVGLSYDF